jgi:beta-lactamase class A
MFVINQQRACGCKINIGIVILPDGKKFAIALFVSDSMENEKTNDGIMADVAKVIWDYGLGK